MKKARIVKPTDEDADRSEEDPFPQERLLGFGPFLLKVLDEVSGHRDFQGEKIRTIETRGNPLVDRADGFEGRNPLRADFLGQSEFPERSGTKKKEVSRKGSEKSAVGISTDDHSSRLVERNGWVRGSSPPIRGDLGLSGQKRVEFDDPPFEKHFPYVVSQEKKVFPPTNQREGGQDRSLKRRHGLWSKGKSGFCHRSAVASGKAGRRLLPPFGHGAPERLQAEK